MPDFIAWLRNKNMEAAQAYNGPRSAMAGRMSFDDFTDFLLKDDTKEMTKKMLAYLSTGTEIAHDCKNGVVSDRIVDCFNAAFTIAYYPDQEFFLTTKELPENARLMELARTMLGFFEHVLDLFAEGRVTVVVHFVSAAREFFQFFREWLPRDRLRVVRLTHTLLLERHIQGLPETDPYGSLLRRYLGNAGGQRALNELDFNKASVTALARAFGIGVGRDAVLVVRMVVRDTLDGEDAEPSMSEEEPTTFTEEPELVEAAVNDSSVTAPAA